MSRLQWLVLISLGLGVICLFAFLFAALAFPPGYSEQLLVRATSTLISTRQPTHTPRPTPKPTATLTAQQRITAYYPIDPRDVAKNPDRYVGQRIKVFGRVFDISESGGETILQITSCPASEEQYVKGYGDVVFVIPPRICETSFDRQEPLIVFYSGVSDGLYNGHWVAVYGTVSRSVSGTNALRTTWTRPAIDADYLLFPLGRDDVVGTNW